MDAFVSSIENDPMLGHPGSYEDTGVSSHYQDATGAAAGVISRPTAQSLGLDQPHAPDFVPNWHRPLEDQPTMSIQEMMYKIGMFDGGHDSVVDSRGTPNKPSGYAADNVPLHLFDHWGQTRKENEASHFHPERMIRGVEPLFWGSAYNPSTDGSVKDMLDGPKMYTPRGEPDTSPDAIFKAPDLAVNPRDISLDNHSAVWTYDNTYAGWNDRLLFDPTPVDPYGPDLPGLFDNQFQPSR